MSQSTSTIIDSPAGPKPDRAIARRQALLCLMILLIIGLAVAVAQVLVRHDQMLLARRVQEWKAINGTYLDGRYFPSGAERLLYNVLPDADYSRGGVYFIGSSPTQQALLPWEFTATEQKRVGNYCISGSHHATQFEFVRYLIEQHGLLQAGGEKNTVVLELIFGSSCHDPTVLQKYMDDVWQGYFTRYNLFEFVPGTGLRETPMSPLSRRLRVENIRTHVFWSWLLRHDKTYISPPSHTPRPDVEKYWIDRMGPNWQAGMDVELQNLGEMVDYLRDLHANVEALYFPQRPWADDFPAAVRYRQKVMALMSAKSVHVTDLIHAAPEQDFCDSVHLNYTGSMAIQPYYQEIARRQLQKLQ